ncbi:biliverdin-producing heme oxygenase [Nocardioides sp. KIGAM211]|uniref:heme oxygenase (biliverdin-producing) n=1 Tax=Nocardioides luti TaxID=2761101 RepID=A0A7X0VAD7_9ACTN|nr:biliverdin-producing heme oxygenase [Nocardioides luti]MBB6627476.1 biliverdin-producing heme oxygenase [Nocardioides luti]
MTSSVPAATTPLSAALRDGTRAEHEDAESSGFVTDLVAGRAPAWQYAAYLRRLRAVYGALEAAVHDHRAHPALAAVHDEDLRRAAALDADVAHWSGSTQGPSTASGSSAATAYAARIDAARRRPHLLVAHHYTRYLGDLSGGRILADALRRGYARHGLDRGGLAFYDFAAIPKPVPYKRGYRDRLDAIALTRAEQDEVVAEARVAFRLNRAVFDEVAALHDDEQRVALRR